MKNIHKSIPIGMFRRDFFCHRCGTKLLRLPKVKVIERGHPDYKKYTRRNWVCVGDVEVTEYEFRCRTCQKDTAYDTQLIIEYIQKQTGRRRLSEEEIAQHTAEAQKQLSRKRKITNALMLAGFFIGTILLYLLIKYIEKYFM